MTKTLATSLAIFAMATVPALAGSFQGKILAHDRVAHRIVMEDKTVVTYDLTKIKLPEDLKAGDEIQVEFTGAEGDMAAITAITAVKQ